MSSTWLSWKESLAFQVSHSPTTLIGADFANSPFIFDSNLLSVGFKVQKAPSGILHKHISHKTTHNIYKRKVKTSQPALMDGIGKNN